MNLAEQRCEPPRAGAAPLSPQEAEELVRQVPSWTLGDKQLERMFRFGDFRAAMQFVNEAAKIADEQDHHPDILISYNKVRLTLTTHKIGGLSKNDFIVAARIDTLIVDTRYA